MGAFAFSTVYSLTLPLCSLNYHSQLQLAITSTPAKHNVVPFWILSRGGSKKLVVGHDVRSAKSSTFRDAPACQPASWTAPAERSVPMDRDFARTTHKQIKPCVRPRQSGVSRLQSGFPSQSKTPLGTPYSTLKIFAVCFAPPKLSCGWSPAILPMSCSPSGDCGVMTKISLRSCKTSVPPARGPMK
jgi:hypothetical protein